MVTSNRPVSTAKAVSSTTENSVSAPPVNDDAGAKQADPDVQNKSDLQSLLCQRNKSLTELQVLYDKSMFDLSIEQHKTKQLEKDRNVFRSGCRKTANQGITGLKHDIGNLKESMKAQEKIKQSLLQARDLKYKELLVLYRANLKDNKQQVGTIADLHKTHDKDVKSMSNLKGDIMSKIRQCEIFKKDNKSLKTQVSTLERKSSANDERKMEHELELKNLTLKTEALKVKNVQQTNFLKDKTNQHDHTRKIQAISFLAKARQRGKDIDEQRKNKAKQKKFQGGADQMGVLMGEIRKQTNVNGGCVPNPGTTPIPVVSFLFRCILFGTTVLH
jgi:hypothetical protein